MRIYFFILVSALVMAGFLGVAAFADGVSPVEAKPGISLGDAGAIKGCGFAARNELFYGR